MLRLRGVGVKHGVSRGESPVGAQAPCTRMPTRTRPGLRWARPSGATTDCYPDDHAPTPPRDSLPWSGDWTGTTRLRPPFRRWLHRRKVAGGLLSFASRLAVSRGSARTSRAAARPRSVNALLIPASCPSHAASVEPVRVHRQRRWFAEEQSSITVGCVAQEWRAVRGILGHGLRDGALTARSSAVRMRCQKGRSLGSSDRHRCDASLLGLASDLRLDRDPLTFLDL